jgi:hypothetical protein
MFNYLQHPGIVLSLIKVAHFKGQYNLMSDNEVIAVLTVNQKLKSGGVIEINGKRWEVKQQSFWRSELGIFEYGFELPFASFHPKAFSDSILELPLGLKLYIRTKLFKSTIELITQSGDVLLSLKGKVSLKEMYYLTILKPGKELAEYPWLIMLPAFISIIKKRRSAP